MATSFRTITQHLLELLHPRAMVLGRDGDIIAAPHGPPPIDDASVRDAVTRLDTGRDFVVVDTPGEPTRAWRLQPIAPEGRVEAVVALPCEDHRAHDEPLAPSNDTETAQLTRPPPQSSASDIAELIDDEFAVLIADQLADLSETTTILISVVDTDYRYRFVSQGYAKWFGLDRGESLVGQHVRDVVGPKAFARIEPAHIRVLQGQQVDMDVELTLSGVGHKHTQVRYIPIRGATGRVLGFYALIFDLTPHASLKRALAETEAKFHELTEYLDTVLWSAAGEYPNIGLTYVSPAYEQVFGRPTEYAFSGLEAWLELVVPQDRERVLESLSSSAPVTEYQYRIRLPDGAIRWILAKSYPVFDDAGRVLRLFGFATDITAHKEVESALRASEQRFRVALEGTPIIVFHQDLELRYTWLNRVEVGPVEDVLGRRDIDLMLEREQAEHLEAIKRRVIETGVGVREEILIDVDGEELVYDLTLEPLRDESGEIIGLTGAGTNVTRMYAATKAQRAALERMVAERTENLARSEAHLRAVLETASEVIVSIDPHGTIVSCNRAMHELLGHEPEGMAGRDIATLLPELGDEGVAADQWMGHEVTREGRDMLARAASGEEIPVRFTLSETRVAGERLWVGVLRDRRPEERAREASHYHATLVESIADAVIATDLQMNVVTWSGGAEKIYGWRAEEVVGLNVAELLQTELVVSLEEATRQLFEKGAWKGEGTQVRKDGSRVTISGHITQIRDAAGQPVGVLAINADITALKELQAQYTQAQKMEAMGRLTAGIAHDFGNLLMSISGCAALALSKIDASGDAARYLRTLIDAVKRGASLSRQLMSYTREREAHPVTEWVDLDTLVMSAGVLLERLVGAHIELSTELSCPGGLVGANASQLEQILVNLIINAADAMPKGGTITIQTQSVEVTAPEAERRGLPREGSYARLTVRDTGHGMSEATRSRIFEPFFTTKPVDRGTGLGLSTVYALVRDMGGGIEVQSQEGQGTSFTLFFPWTEPSSSAGEAQQALPRGAETILLVEDETLVRLTVRYYLESLGYTVLEVNGPLDALDLCRTHQGHIHLLLSDVVMPELGGPETVERARALRSDLHVLLMSAHAQEHLLAQGRLRPGDDILHKPFTREELARAVRATLDAPSEATTEAAAPAPAEATEPTTGLRLLVVDDAKITLQAIEEFLVELGYLVVPATTGQGALAEFMRDPSAIDLLLTDLSLPDMTGQQLVEEVRRRWPETPVIYMSGYGRERAGVSPQEQWLRKPFDFDQLLTAIEAARSGR